jgi:hypothetical protein
MKTAYVHIGSQKTGTSSIQYCLEKNRNNLIKQKYLVPKSLGFAKHDCLSVSCHDTFRNDSFCKILGLQSFEQWSQFRANIWDDLRKEISIYPNHHLILSAESFVGSLESASEISLLKQRIRDLGFSQIKVVIYLRNPSDMMQSNHFTDVVYWGSCAKNAAEPTDKFANHICDFKSRILAWMNVFGRDSMIVRLYEPEQNKTICAIDDFLSLLPSLDQNKLRKTEIKNTSSSALGITVAAKVNERLPFIDDGRVNPMRKDLGSYLRKHFPGVPYRMTDRQRKAYDEYYAESNEWVRREFFPQRDVLFYPKPPQSISAEENHSNDNLDLLAAEAISYLEKQYASRLWKMAIKQRRQKIISWLKNCFYWL